MVINTQHLVNILALNNIHSVQFNSSQIYTLAIPERSLEDTKGVIRSHKKDGQKKKDKSPVKPINTKHKFSINLLGFFVE
jgi:hypothetical protein